MDFIPFLKEELQQRQTLFTRAFPETVGTATETNAHYQWKFHGKPLGSAKKNSYEYVAMDAEVMTGYYAAIPYHYLVNGESLEAGMVCDVMTDPDHQGKGIFTRLGRYATDQIKAEGLDITTGYPIRDAVIPGHLKVGWKAAFKLPMFVRLTGTRTLPVLKKLPEFIHIFSSGLIRFIYSIFEILGPHSKFKSSTIHSLSELDEVSYENFLSRWSTQAPITLQKNISFLKWRLSAPDTKYSIVTLSDESSSRIQAVLICRSAILQGVRTLAILDWMEDESALIPRRAFSKILNQISKSERTDLIALMAGNTAYSKLKLKRLFFVPSPAKFTFIVKNLSNRFSDDLLTQESNWRLMWIDSDDL